MRHLESLGGGGGEGGVGAFARTGFEFGLSPDAPPPTELLRNQASKEVDATSGHQREAWQNSKTATTLSIRPLTEAVA